MSDACARRCRPTGLEDRITLRESMMEGGRGPGSATGGTARQSAMWHPGGTSARVAEAPCARLRALASARPVRHAFGPGAQAFFLGPQLRGEFGAEIGGLEHRANFDLGVAFHGVGAAPEPFDGLLD